MNQFARISNALFIIVLSIVIGAAYFEQYHFQELPCPLCLLQRLMMIGTALGLVLNLKFGIRPAHYGLSLLFVVLGCSIALRQIALHVCPGFPYFGVPVFGLSLYTWSFIVLFCSSIAIAVLLFFCPKDSAPPSRMNWLEKGAISFLILIVLTNVITTFIQCGIGPCEDVPWPQPESGTVS